MYTRTSRSRYPGELKLNWFWSDWAFASGGVRSYIGLTLVFRSCSSVLRCTFPLWKIQGVRRRIWLMVGTQLITLLPEWPHTQGSHHLAVPLSCRGPGVLRIVQKWTPGVPMMRYSTSAVRVGVVSDTLPLGWIRQSSLVYGLDFPSDFDETRTKVCQVRLGPWFFSSKGIMDPDWL